MIKQNKVTIYTDGAAKGNPGPAGWGVVFLVNDKVIEMGGGREHAIGWKLKQSTRVGDLFFAPGNGGTMSMTNSGVGAERDQEGKTHCEGDAKRWW